MSYTADWDIKVCSTRCSLYHMAPQIDLTASHAFNLRAMTSLEHITLACALP